MDHADPVPADARVDRERQRDAFRELHGRRLHGFALLLTLGDRGTAARLAADALEAGADRLESHRHPERAAAWLRARVTARARRDRSPSRDEVIALAELGVGAAALAGLAALDRRTRAAVIAHTVEGLDRRDVATIAGREGRALDRLLERGLRQYAAAATSHASADAPRFGPLAERLDEVVRRAIA